VRFGDQEIAVAQNEHRAAALVVRAALHMVQHWGIVSVDAVVERARALGSNVAVDARLATRLLNAASGTRWLDWPDRRWFSFAAPASQLDITIRKILAVATSVRVERLREGLTKAVPALADAPHGVVEQYLRQIVRCAVDGGMVRRAAGSCLDRAILSPAEGSLVQMLEQAGGTMELSALRRRAVLCGLPEATSRRVLKISPLFLLAQGGPVRLIGSDLDGDLVPLADNRFAPQAIHG
jgi:hypothetical protein